MVDEIDVGKVSIGQSVSIKVAAYRDKEFIGTVSKIEPKAYVQQNVTTFPVLIDIDNDENLLLIGMNTDVVIEVLNKDVAMSIPTMSLRTRKDIYTAASIIDIEKEEIDQFLVEKVKGENFNKFIVITDDENTARQYIGDYPYHHVDVGFDFYVVNQSKYLILSNSSFGWWAGWLNQKTKITIAPKYWSQHNVSDGYWGLGDQYSRCFNYMDRNGELLTYDTCRIEAINYYKSKNLI